jgi:hypothetical protein
MKQNRLTTKERKEVIAILTAGSSRSNAARYICRSPATLKHEILECPQFATQVARAEETAELFLLSNIRKASQDTRYWRAAAWLLERRAAERFGPRKPETLTEEHVQKFMAKCMQIIAEKVPNKALRAEIFNRIASELEN